MTPANDNTIRQPVIALYLIMMVAFGVVVLV